MFVSIASLLILADPGAGDPPVPQLRAGQELVYQGEYHLISERSGHQSDLAYDIEHHVFVMNTNGRGIDLALVTLSRAKSVGQGSQRAIGLALGFYSPSTGLKLYPPTTTWESDPSLATDPLPRLPLAGPPRLVNGSLYLVSPAAWEAGRFEPIKGTRARRLDNRTESPDWARPNDKQIAWMAEDTVWFSPMHGYALRSLRRIQLRDPSEKLKVTHVELDMSFSRRIQHPGSFGERLRDQLIQAFQFESEYRGLITRLGESTARAQLGKLRGRLGQLLKEVSDPTAQAVLEALSAKVAAAEKGDIAPSDRSR